MTTLLLVAFLAAHGLIHLAIWLPHPEPDPDKPPPFHPDHSAILTATPVRSTATHQLSVALAVVAAAGYLLTAVCVALNLGATLAVAVAAALLGIALKLLFFNPWLTIGLLLDAAVLFAALYGWPMSLS